MSTKFFCFVTIFLLISGSVLRVNGADCPDTPAPDPGAVATCNGDVNGDESINVADAIYLLGYLFLLVQSAFAFGVFFLPAFREPLSSYAAAIYGIVFINLFIVIIKYSYCYSIRSR